MPQRSAAALLACASLVTLLAGPALAAPPQVVADIPVVASLAQQVLGNLGEVRVLLPAGGNAHDYQMRPSDTAALQDAGLLVWVGPELTPWLDRAASNVAGGASLPLLAVPDTHHRDFGDAHGHGDDHDDHSHDHDTVDPHAWLDPENGKLWLTAIADALARSDPDNAATYTSNAAAGAARIDQTAALVKDLLTPAAGAEFVVFHDAYGYFTDSFGLSPAIAVSLGDASTPSAARLTAIREQIAAAQATCAFPEAGHDAGLMTSALEGTDVQIGGALDPEGTNLAIGPTLYTDLLQGLGEVIAECVVGRE